MVGDAEDRARVGSAAEDLPVEEVVKRPRFRKAPTRAELPVKRAKGTRGGPDTVEISLRLETITPILGGGYRTRHIDTTDHIRVPTIRGHLRFWWRTLRSHNYDDAAALYKDEGELWGQAATGEGRRSVVEARVEVEQNGVVDNEPIELVDSKKNGKRATPGAYALWPARKQSGDPGRGRPEVPTAPRVRPGVCFRLTLVMPKERAAELRDAVRAWLLFGGYGSRTRRGLGSLKVIDDVGQWLPPQVTRDGFEALFGRDIFRPADKMAVDTPWLAGASLLVGQAEKNPEKAWTTALDWLKAFRQGTEGGPGRRAREPGDEKKHQPWRPSLSNWPEADKIRHLKGKTVCHPPRHNAVPVWPRAGFGLPVIGQFQKSARDGSGELDEPGNFELRWQFGGKEYDRLASPLIVKALPLANGLYAPCALWLNRAYPPGEVTLRDMPGSGASFDLLFAPGDRVLFSPLEGKSSLREAFLDWLRARPSVKVVVP